jgi:hypothetical protein
MDGGGAVKSRRNYGGRTALISRTKVYEELAMTQTYDPHKDTNEVRQGNGRMMNSRVLIISMSVVVILFLAIYFLFFANTPPTAI